MNAIHTADQSDKNPTFPIIGIGASAGGLVPFEKVLESLPRDFGAAIVFIQRHLADKKRLLPEILRNKFPSRDIIKITNGMTIVKGKVYVNQPDHDITIESGHFRAKQRLKTGAHLPIDTFFTSLAEAAGGNAVAVVLSGAGSDGSRGVREVQCKGGAVLVQDPDTAEFPGMPKSAIKAGAIDEALTPGTIARRLVTLVGAISKRHGELRCEPRTNVEELKRVNEELITVNAQLQSTIEEQKATNGDLNKEMEKFKAIFDNSNDGITIVDHATGRYIDCNKKMQTMIGYKFEEICAMKAGDFWSPQHKGKVESHLEKVMAGGISREEIEIIAKDGSVIPVEYNAFQVTVGARRCIVNVLRDITIRKTAEREAQSLAKFPSENPCPVFRLSREGIVLYSNRPGEPFLRMWNAAKGSPLPEEIRRKIAESVAGRSPTTIDIECNERIYSFHVAPVPEVGYVNLYGLDITARAQAEKALRENEKKYRLLTENIPDSLTTLNRNLRIIYWNRAAEKITGISAAEAMGKTRAELFGDSEESKKYFDCCRKCMNTREVVKCEIENIINGRKYHFESWFFSTSEGVSVISRDITNRKNAEKALQEANALLHARNAELDSFNYLVSHDLRGPLRAVGAFSKMLGDEYGAKLDNEGKKYLDQISKSTDRMAHIIDDLLKLSRITKAEINRVDVDLGGIAKTLARDLMHNGPEREVEFLIDDIVIHADAGLMQIVMENLFSNAWKFTSKKPHARIEFSSRREGDKTIYFVRDNGEGFNMTHSQKLFTPFQRLHSNSEFPGTGIGLAIIRRIIERHGGKVWAESEVGSGATIYFEVPAVLDIK